MVLVKIDGNKRTYMCDICDNIIAQGIEYFIDPSSIPNFKYTASGNRIYYKCRCGSNHELIRDSNPKIPNGLKFKKIIIISQK